MKPEPSQSPAPSGGEVLLYQTEDGLSRVECRFQGETLWLSLNEIAVLFGRDKSVISKHLKGIFDDGELARDSVVANYATTAADGKTYRVDYYNLEAILAVGYRVRSPRGVQFRTWASARLKEFLVKGFVMDDERLKNPDSSVYFEQLLARIRDIRSSEKIFWRKICDIYATSIDYDGKSETSQAFFAQVQNKMHWAAHGQEPRRSEIAIAKNYLSESELEILNRTVNAYLEFAELQARRGRLMKMADWSAKLDDFLKLGEQELLTHAGKISAEQAKEKAEREYDRYRKVIDLEPTQVDKDLQAAIEKLKLKGAKAAGKLPSPKKKGGKP